MTYLANNDVEMIFALRLRFLYRCFRSRNRFRNVQSMQVNFIHCAVRVILYRQQQERSGTSEKFIDEQQGRSR